MIWSKPQVNSFPNQLTSLRNMNIQHESSLPWWEHSIKLESFLSLSFPSFLHASMEERERASVERREESEWEETREREEIRESGVLLLATNYIYIFKYIYKFNSSLSSHLNYIYLYIYVSLPIQIHFIWINHLLSHTAFESRSSVPRTSRVSLEPNYTPRAHI